MNITTLRPARVNPLWRHSHEQRLPLDGAWGFRLDPDDCGVADGWFRPDQPLDGAIAVPGCWQGQGFGGEGTDRVRDFQFETRVFRATDRGTGWYGRTFRVPPEWSGRRIWLNFGGVHPSADVWLNGEPIGANDLPFVPFAFDVTDVVRRDAENALRVRVHERHREFGLAFDWQGNWSGLYRGVDLTATGACWIERCALLPDADAGVLRVRAAIGGDSCGDARLTVRVAPADESRPACQTEFVVSEAVGEWQLAVPDALRWSPDQPHLYRVDIALRRAVEVCDAQVERIGFVTFDTRGQHFRINGEPYYLRGSGDFISCPETGCPDTDRDRWRRKLRALRDYGYNYVRCQSYVYGPEYYDVADEVGLLVQSEMGLLGAWGGHSAQHVYQWPKPTPDNLPVLKAQWDLVVERDVCHPSANLYCMSNEYWGNTDFPRLAWSGYRRTKAIKPTAQVIWTDGGFNADLPGDFINHGISAFKPDELKTLDKPLILHEYQWWSSFPDVRLRDRYDGAIRPYAIEIAAEAARRHGQEHLLETYAVNSQRLQFIEAKVKMEAMRRDVPVLAGINHFDAMDANPSPQGIIDEFYETKLVDAAGWRETNGDTVVLSSMGFDDRCWTAGTEVRVRFHVSDFAHPPMREPVLAWRLREGTDTLREGRLAFAHVPFTTVLAGESVIPIPNPSKATAATLEAVLTEAGGGRTVVNRWAVWLFPETPVPHNVVLHGKPRWTWLRHWAGRLPAEPASAAGAARPLILTETLDDAVLAHLRAGGNALLAAGEGLVRPHAPLFGYVKYFFTPPANYSPYEDGQNGTVIADHPLLNVFPHDGFADWQFFRMIENAPPLDIGSLGLADGASAADPVLRVIHRYPTLRPLAYLVERRVGAGRLLLCALELHPDWIEARWLMHCLRGGASGPVDVQTEPLSATSLAILRQATAAD